jgi:hypothetical protein
MIPSDRTECPKCSAENAARGSGRSRPDHAFNLGDQAWNACKIHNVRWYVTRSLLGLRDSTADDIAFTEVLAVDHRGPAP